VSARSIRLAAGTDSHGPKDIPTKGLTAAGKEFVNDAAARGSGAGLRP
jgi:hypothetical protein